ncbi:hypothetical protein PR202_gb28833 [Eleusine coracana subsp. coracana]|uniref:Pectinesterase inhibitor domain-containing protein n=1 Tax=Eleusine coracana subsp. coracana TaxID=191504 RepID=A0AAV5FY20_ELECO|nr:hypothetical protein QOZ80_8BG0644590 [Eleusine coracana subsp. coracana]GJN39698.1 hypothetical protein PR202_gb28833 [Eleusine coracana subsp. coracana]
MATTSSLLLLFLLSLLLLPPARYGAGDGCPQQVASMTAESACNAVCGTPHMRELCLGTLAAPSSSTTTTASSPVTDLAMAAVRGALDAYAATTAAATSLIDGGAVQGDGEKAAYGGCMVGYGRARIAMARVADDLLAAAGQGGGGCDGDKGSSGPGLGLSLSADYTVGLRGMDMCGRGIMGYPASPLYAMNLADRNKTLLAALLCSLVAPPPQPGGGGGHSQSLVARGN